MPGPLLAKIYSLYGPRLLEQNVRTFLQAKTKVNRGIIETIVSNPRRFFAYNNGITATASSLETNRLDDGSLADLINKKLADRQRRADDSIDTLRKG